MTQHERPVWEVPEVAPKRCDGCRSGVVVQAGHPGPCQPAEHAEAEPEPRRRPAVPTVRLGEVFFPESGSRITVSDRGDLVADRRLRCWRCGGPGPAGASGLCGECQPTEPSEGPEPSTGLVRSRRRSRWLRVGEVVRLDPGPEAPVFTVVRVNECAAYLAPGDWTDYQGRVLEREWSSLLGVSPTAFVFREV